MDPSTTEEASSLYGPGSWAAWIVLVISSWIFTLREDYSHNMHHWSYIFYTNFSAVVYLHSLISRGPGRKKNDVFITPRDWEYHETKTAAMAVVYLGTINSLLQFLVVRRQTRRQASGSQPSSEQREREILLQGGLLLPSLVVACRGTIETYLVTTDIWSDLGGLGVFSIVMATVAIILALASNFISRYNYYSNFRPFRLSMRTGVLLLSAYCLYGSNTMVSLTTTNWERSWTLPPFTVIPSTNYKLSELDQAFALAFSLFFFLYEFVPWRLAASKVKDIVYSP